MAIVEIVYASKQEQFLKRLQVPDGISVSQALKLADIEVNCPNIDKNSIKAGIYGKAVSLETILQDRDRIEIYRELTIDPKEIRRKKSKRITAVANAK